MTHYSKNGFTLVELAIALMVIGLLIGGVLKGQELIENARITSFMRQVKAYDAAAMIFRNTYGALPGDIKRPNRIPNCTDEICSRPGNGNGKIKYDDTSPTGTERFNFFPHLTKAGMIQGPEGGDATQMASVIADNRHVDSDKFFPVLAIDTIYRFFVESQGSTWYSTPYAPINHYQPWLLSGRQATTIDSKMDDGISYTGDIRAEDYADCTVDNDPEGDYDTQIGLCVIMIGAGF